MPLNVMLSTLLKLRQMSTVIPSFQLLISLCFSHGTRRFLWWKITFDILSLVMFV